MSKIRKEQKKKDEKNKQKKEKMKRNMKKDGLGPAWSWAIPIKGN